MQYYKKDPLERKCDKCGKHYSLNSVEIPRIIIRRKLILNDLNAKDSYANPDFCFNCTTQILNFLQSFTPLRFSGQNNQNNNLYLSKEDNEILSQIRFKSKRY